MDLIREDTITRLKGYFDLVKPAPVISRTGIRQPEQEKLLIRPDARKFLVRCSRCNINFAVQQRIFSIRYKWTFTQLLEILVDPQYKFEVLPNHNHFERLCQAIEQNNQKEITELLNSSHIDLSMHNFHLLYVASQFGNIDVVKHLLTIPNIDINSDNPMVIACEFGHYEIVKLLYERGADPSIADSFSFRLAAENGYANIVKLFINDPRINVNAQDEYAIKQACEENHHQVVKILMDHPKVAYQADIYSPVLVDCVHHGGKLLRTLLADNKIGYPGNRPGLSMAKLFGYAKVNYCLETCKILLADLRVDPSNYFVEDCTDPEVLLLLMKEDRFSKTEGKMQSSLLIATKKGWLNIVEIIFNNFESYINMDTLGESKMDYCNRVVFPLASKRGQVEVMKFLYQNGVTHFWTSNYLSFFNAIKYGHLPAVEYLITLGVNPFYLLDKAAYIKAFNHSRFEILQYLFSLNEGYQVIPIPLNIVNIQTQIYPPESYINLISYFGKYFKFENLDTEKSSRFYADLCIHETGYKLISYFIDHFPSCKQRLVMSTPISTQKKLNRIHAPHPRPVDFLSTKSPALFTVVYHYYQAHCQLLLELTPFLLDDVIRYIFEFMLMSGFPENMCISEIEDNYSTIQVNSNTIHIIDELGNGRNNSQDENDDEMQAEDDEDDDDDDEDDSKEYFESDALSSDDLY